jgi:integrase
MEKDRDAYLKKKREEMAKYRAKRRAQEEQDNKEPINVVKIEIPSPQPIQQQKTDVIVLEPKKLEKRDLTYKSIETYITNLKKIHHLITKSKFEDVDIQQITNIFKNTDYDKTIYNKIEYYKIDNIKNTIEKIKDYVKCNNTFRTRIISITSLLSNLEEFKEEYKYISSVASALSNLNEEHRAKNEIKKDDVVKLISFDIKDIKKRLKSIKDIQEKAFYIIYITSIRRLEIRSVKLSRVEDKNGNVLIIKNRTPIRFIFNDYKTSATFKTQIFELPKIAQTIVKKYIKVYNKQIGDYLFTAQPCKNIEYSEDKFSLYFTSIFKKIYNENITNTWLRRSWVTYRLNTNQTKEEIENDAKFMAHSLDIHLTYKRQTII